MKKVLFVATVYTHLDNFHKPFMRLLQLKGYEVHAAANSNEGGMDAIEQLDVVCHDISFARSPLSAQNRRALKQLATLFQTHDFTLIHVNTPIAAFLCRYQARRYDQGQILYTAHGFHFYQGAPLMNWALYYPLERLAKRWTDGLIVMNEEDAEQAQKMGFVRHEDLFFVNGVGVDETIYRKKPRMTASEIRQQLNIPETAFVVVCVAEFSKNKNQIMLIRAWERLVKQHKDIHLIFAGSGATEAELKEAVTEKNIPHVHFLGKRSDFPDILQASNCLVLVSKREGLPKSVMEGMVSGRPAIVTNVRGSRDLVTHEETGFIVEVDDDEALVQALHDLMSNDDLCTQMGEAAVRAVEPFTLPHVLEHMERIYRKMLSGDGEVSS
ncbi:glycosyltransferase family 4 protein [Lentibacillus saliphilus]|uniref:glycosyltransferase family 4 protein n=1 Tax=Lentibacillus saliphilus TaxID=2737028 RepID=UPI001C30D017|nr:glycosyltransferase family 4 protein [Lentibacillus saliphilus]